MRQTGDCFTLRSRLASFSRRQIRVSKVIVHENFTASLNDIALLKLGRNISGDPLIGSLACAILDEFSYNFRKGGGSFPV